MFLLRTKKQQEEEIRKDEISLKNKQSEMMSIENEIETLIQMLKQLENQKNDAVKKLKDLDTQVCTLTNYYKHFVLIIHTNWPILLISNFDFACRFA